MFCLLVDHWEKLSAFSEPLFNNVGAVIEFVFHSNLAEGAEVDEGATRRLIHDAVGTQPLSEAQPMLIACNDMQSPAADTRHGHARRFVLQHLNALMFVRELGPTDLTPDTLKRLHEVLMQGLQGADEDAVFVPGEFRTEGCRATGIAGRNVQYLDHEKIPEAIDTLLRDVAEKMRQLEPLGQLTPDAFYLAAELLVRFLAIHPFGDGNGRVARLLVHWVLHHHGFSLPLTLVKGKYSKAKRHYLQVLDAVQHKDQPVSKAATFILSHTLHAIESYA